MRTMALEQTLVSTRKSVDFVLKNRFSATRFSAPTSPFSLRFYSDVPRRSNFRRSLKCSVDYKDQGYDFQASYARPPEIPWSKELCNTVHLIGVVGNPVEIRHLSSGKVVAWTRFAVKKSSTDSAWINLTLWDELANIAYQHVEKGQQIYVSGRLVSDTIEGDDGKKQTYYKVVVRQLNFVERSSISMSSYDLDSNWTSGKRFGSYGASASSIEELWQAFFANPVEWWDNRKSKVLISLIGLIQLDLDTLGLQFLLFLNLQRNPKYPDFKHKDNGEALWIEGRNNPSWVKSQLQILDSRTGSLSDRDERMHVKSMSADEVLPF
ncbi:hypothetical protein SLEP1_g30323 [Rubroshorea leprosula]|uniref:Uncharacterized protein n=1 Tax=Rubroshorea leprosula TaxID=152421 RepID=A0AAV5K5F5_9ROSI|nr:hypothetical protein SLEP1_g30323 [Rubroshorea leprosula]